MSRLLLLLVCLATVVLAAFDYIQVEMWNVSSSCQGKPSDNFTVYPDICYSDDDTQNYSYAYDIGEEGGTCIDITEFKDVKCTTVQWSNLVKCNECQATYPPNIQYYKYLCNPLHKRVTMIYDCDDPKCGSCKQSVTWDLGQCGAYSNSTKHMLPKEFVKCPVEIDQNVWTVQDCDGDQAGSYPSWNAVCWSNGPDGSVRFTGGPGPIEPQQ